MVRFYKVALLLFLLGCLPAFASAATLSLSPAGGSLKVGERLAIKVIVTGDKPLNAVSGTVLFPPSIFAIESVLKADSLLNFWVSEPTANKSTGVVHFEGVALGGFSGGSGTVVTVTLRAVKAGTAAVSFPAGQVLANDGQGTDITSGLSGGNFSVVTAPAVENKPAPAETKPTPESAPKTEAPQPAPSLAAPEIMLGSKYGAPAIIGSSQYPKAQVLLTFVAPDGGKIFITGQADEDGSFVLLVPSALRHGAYTVTAVMIKSDQTNSAPSKSIVIMVGNIFSDLSWEIKLVLLLLIITVIYLAIRTFAHLRRVRALRRAVKREAREAESMLHQSFDVLRDDLSGQAKGKTKAADLRKDLRDAEEVISKEIKDIESV